MRVSFYNWDERLDGSYDTEPSFPFSEKQCSNNEYDDDEAEDSADEVLDLVHKGWDFSDTVDFADFFTNFTRHGISFFI